MFNRTYVGVEVGVDVVGDGDGDVNDRGAFTHGRELVVVAVTDAVHAHAHDR
jgi:hypothetical protein